MAVKLFLAILYSLAFHRRGALRLDTSRSYLRQWVLAIPRSLWRREHRRDSDNGRGWTDKWHSLEGFPEPCFWDEPGLLFHRWHLRRSQGSLCMYLFSEIVSFDL